MRAFPRAFTRAAAPRAIRVQAAAPAVRAVAAFSSSARSMSGHEESFEEFSARYIVTKIKSARSMAVGRPRTANRAFRGREL